MKSLTRRVRMIKEDRKFKTDIQAFIFELYVKLKSCNILCEIAFFSHQFNTLNSKAISTKYFFYFFFITKTSLGNP